MFSQLTGHRDQLFWNRCKIGYNTETRSLCRGVAQPGSAPALGAGGHRFKSCRPDQSFQSIASLSGILISRMANCHLPIAICHQLFAICHFRQFHMPQPEALKLSKHGSQFLDTVRFCQVSVGSPFKCLVDVHLVFG